MDTSPMCTHVEDILVPSRRAFPLCPQTTYHHTDIADIDTAADHISEHLRTINIH